MSRLAPAGRPNLSGGGRLVLWLAASFTLGIPYPWVAPLNPPWTFLLLGAPLLLCGWLTRPLNPGWRLLGFLLFLAGAGAASVAT